MKAPTLSLALPLIVACLAIVAILFIWPGASQVTLEKRVPGRDRTNVQPPEEHVDIALAGELVQGNGVPQLFPFAPSSWPRFRGANLDGILNDNSITIATNWQEHAPRQLWSLEVGEGHAGAAIHAGRVYLLDYDRPRKRDVIRCLSLKDAAEIWSYSYPVTVKRNHGMSRTVPAVTNKYIVSMGPKCHVTCLDAISGRFLWALDLVRQYGAKVPLWYAGQCPLINTDDQVILAPAGSALMIAVDCATGRIIWETPNPHQWKMTHSSIIPMDYDGRRLYLYCASGGIVGVDSQNGSILFASDQWKISIATIASPLPVGDGRIFLSGGYNSGSMMLQLAESAGQISAQPLFRLDPKTFGAAQHTPILYQDHIYGIRPDEQLVCLDLQGNVVWTSTSSVKFGIGPFMIANGLIFAMNDTGLLRLIEATPAGYHQLAQAQIIPDAADSWGPLALASGRLILRDLTRMVCLDITAARQ